MTDEEWRSRASQVIPGGMYGHMSTRALPDGYPQFFRAANGCRLTDVDGNEYIDAATKSEAREHYVKFFNVKPTEKIVVIPVFDGREQVKR